MGANTVHHNNALHVIHVCHFLPVVVSLLAQLVAVRADVGKGDHMLCWMAAISSKIILRMLASQTIITGSDPTTRANIQPAGVHTVPAVLQSENRATESMVTKERHRPAVCIL